MLVCIHNSSHKTASIPARMDNVAQTNSPIDNAGATGESTNSIEPVLNWNVVDESPSADGDEVEMWPNDMQNLAGQIEIASAAGLSTNSNEPIVNSEDVGETQFAYEEADDSPNDMQNLADLLMESGFDGATSGNVATVTGSFSRMADALRKMGKAIEYKKD